ncbi:hypothetical protein H0H93_012142 [Arthromyces matolae]|nr:hypothetical protein H0H93_012142 [Arthromyces matolae]
MSDLEHQPLLPSSANPQREESPTTSRQKAAEFLESARLHKLVILFITIDAACVLADLTYTVLSPDCGAGEELPSWLEFLATVSLVITSFFMLEIPLTVWAFGPKFYNPFGEHIHAGLHLFDAMIIVVTFVLEFVLKGRERELAGLLITLRLWRLVKLVGGVAVGAGEIEEETVKRLAETLEELKSIKTELSVTQSENHELRQRLFLIQSAHV